MAVDPNILEKRDGFIIGNVYGFFYHDDIKFEMTYSKTAISWGFFANKSNRTVCHVKFNSDELDVDL